MPLIVTGLLLFVLAIWMITSWLPSHPPRSTVQQIQHDRALRDGLRGPDDDLHTWRFHRETYRHVQILGLLFAVAGASAILRGVRYRDHEAVICRRCKIAVIGRKVAFGLECPSDDRHLATRDGLVAASLWLVAMVAIVLLVVALG